MSINSRRKGAVGERELIKELAQYGYKCIRPAQYRGNTGNASDVEGLPGIHIECKRVEQLRLKDWMEQAINDTEAEGQGNLPAVFHRKNREKWLVTMCLDDWMELYTMSKFSETGAGL